MTFSQISEAEFIGKINHINWSQFNEPEYYRPDNVVLSLTNLVNLRNEDEKWNIYNDVLFAVGNNHAGTYYPVITEVLPLVTRLLISSPHELVRNCILEILSEWYYSFEPDPGTFAIKTANELEYFVRTHIKQLITETNWNDSERNMKLISDFCNSFNEETFT
ncbi:hypothetical protein [Ferruginibacter sp. SUN106]|uniref:hypothetical protein n=1 Tax=Ferruginibacter sp. SUN106 TaxID=2978348 RepID=UPI003D36D7B3